MACIFPTAKRKLKFNVKLPVQGDDSLGMKFYDRQHAYLLRLINQGDHLDYSQDEVVPVEPVNKLPSIHLGHTVEKVRIVGKSGLLCTRRRIVFGDSAAREQAFHSEIDTIKSLPHPHMVSVWASYTYMDSGYALLSPACDINMKDFTHIGIHSYRILPKQQRRRLILNWLHCLSNGLAFIHNQGYSHGEIKPTNILIDGSNTILFADMGGLRRLEAEHKKAPDLEDYEYDAPENCQRQPFVPAPSPPPSSPTRIVHVGGSRTSRRISTGIPPGPTWDAKSDHARLSGSYDFNSNRPFSSGSNHNRSLTGSVFTFPSLSFGEGNEPTPAQRADIFSLACIYLDLTSFLLKKSNFSSYRAAKNRRAGRGVALPDSSFHQNLGQVESWAIMLDREASKKGDKLFRSVPAVLKLCRQMMMPDPTFRPPAQSVEQELYKILVPALAPEIPHCGTQVTGGV
jgi:serine/threonine protein kinase